MNHPTRKPATVLLTCFAFICFSSTILFAQDNPLQLERLSKANGLSSNIVYSIMQDSKGYLWIGTGEGLARFDGFRFAVFDPQALGALLKQHFDGSSDQHLTVVRVLEIALGISARAGAMTRTAAG